MRYRTSYILLLYIGTAWLLFDMGSEARMFDALLWVSGSSSGVINILVHWNANRR